MPTEYNGLKFYGKYDWNIKENLNKTDIILQSFDENAKYKDVNQVIELYNIKKLIECNPNITVWDENKIKNYQDICSKHISKILGKFFGSIDNNSFLEISNSVCNKYYEDYWNLFMKFKTYKNITGQTFKVYLSKTDTPLHILLKYKILVTHYGKEFAEIMRISEQTPCLIISKFLERHDTDYICYFPKELLPYEYEDILQKYIYSKTANMNCVNLISNAQSTKECPISDKLRLSAKKVYASYWKNNSNAITIKGQSLSVKFGEAENLTSVEKIDNTYEFTYDIKWLTENLDYPTILNNFCYVFEQFDLCWRSSLVSVKSQLGIFESSLFTRGIKEYIKGVGFDFSDALSTIQINGYYRILKDNGVRLEDVFKWFFEEYLLQEFGVNNFRFNCPSKGTTIVEKCRTIASEMDGVLKQFRMYVQDGKIDRELFEMSSEHIVFSNVPSLIQNKYAYENSQNIRSYMYYLFSSQSALYYIEKVGNKYTCLYDLLLKENVSLSDFNSFQKESIRQLIEKNIIEENSSKQLKLIPSKVMILKDLYDHDVICPNHRNKQLNKEINNWLDSGELRIGNSLFTEPEQNYLNYKLNKSVYGNGLDLRNKYAHSTYPEDENIQLNDYINLLKIMVLIITKINDEFYLRDKIQESKIIN